MEVYEAVFTASAEKDLVQIARYFRNQLLEPKLEAEFVRCVKKEVLSLQKRPQRFPLFLDQRLAVLGLRKVMAGDHMLVYFIDEASEKVEIVRILCAKREWISIL